MYNKITYKIVNHIEASGGISSEDREIYLFGVWQGMFMFLGIGTMALVGLLFRAFPYILLFVIAFMPLRSFAGGFHAKTQLRCYLASTITTVFIAIVSPITVVNSSLMIALLLVFAMLIILLSPVGSANKPLDDLEKKVYKRKATKICLFEVFIALVFIPLGVHFVTTGIFWALVMVLILLLLELLFGKKHRTST